MSMPFRNVFVPLARSACAYSSTTRPSAGQTSRPAHRSHPTPGRRTLAGATFGGFDVGGEEPFRDPDASPGDPERTLRVAGGFAQLTDHAVVVAPLVLDPRTGSPPLCLLPAASARSPSASPLRATSPCAGHPVWSLPVRQPSEVTRYSRNIRGVHRGEEGLYAMCASANGRCGKERPSRSVLRRAMGSGAPAGSAGRAAMSARRYISRAPRIPPSPRDRPGRFLGSIRGDLFELGRSRLPPLRGRVAPGRALRLSRSRLLGAPSPMLAFPSACPSRGPHGVRSSARSRREDDRRARLSRHDRPRERGGRNPRQTLGGEQPESGEHRAGRSSPGCQAPA